MTPREYESFIFYTKWATVLNIILACIFLFLSVACADPVRLTASWYSVQSLKDEGTYKYSKGVCADGSIFSENKLTCACRLFPLHSRLCVTNCQTGKSVIVTVVDRIGKRFARTRIDLSKRAFSEIAPLERGVVEVEVTQI